MQPEAHPICPNCESRLEGQYCSFCGQKHYEHKESFRELVYEFFSDFTHFDSRFFRTILPLIFKPGTLTRRYNEGHRKSQFHPIRLYLFSSFVYFLFFFGCSDHSANKGTPLVSNPDSLNVDSLVGARAASKGVTIARSKDSMVSFSLVGIKGLDSLVKNHITPDQYIQSQNSLPVSQRDNFIRRAITRQGLKLYYEGQKDQQGLFSRLTSAVLHNIPKMLFVLLPLFALLLKLLYLRHKQYYYVDHAVLSLHYFSFIFIVLLIVQYFIGLFIDSGLIQALAILWIVVYLFIAMKRIYHQSFGKTLLKYSLLGISFFVIGVIAFLLNVLISAAMA